MGICQSIQSDLDFSTWETSWIQLFLNPRNVEVSSRELAVVCSVKDAHEIISKIKDFIKYPNVLIIDLFI